MNMITFHGDDVRPSSLNRALFHILPVPLEKTVSYGGGTADGPQAILEASCQLELFDGTSIPAENGIYTAEPISCQDSIESILANLQSQVGDIVQQKAVPVVLGGEHSLSIGCVRGIKKHHPDFGVIQLDAHADLRDSYEGSRNSHACVMHRILDEHIPIYQVGTRSYSLEEHRLRQRENIAFTDAAEICKKGAAAVTLPRDFPEMVYITFDADCFDVSLMPATGTPVPGGLHWYHVIEILENIFRDRICLGFDLVEFAPQPNMHGAGYTMAQLTYTMMGMLTRTPKNKSHFNI